MGSATSSIAVVSGIACKMQAEGVNLHNWHGIMFSPSEEVTERVQVQCKCVYSTESPHQGLAGVIAQGTS